MARELVACCGVLFAVACSSSNHAGQSADAAVGGTAVGGSAGTGGSTASGGSATGGAGTGAHPGTGGIGAGGGHASGTWSMGYYASYKPDQYPVAEIEWTGLTQIAFAFYEPGSDGSLSLLGQDPDVAQQVIQAAHAHGAKALASIGGSESATLFRQAIGGSLDAFVNNLEGLLDSPGYDGLDFDWEPLEHTDEPTMVALGQRIRKDRPSALLTIPIGYVNTNSPPDLSGYPAFAAVFDQLNVMTYGMAGAWQGWKSWHSSAIYQNDTATPISIDRSVAAYLDAGVPAGKLGFGVGFYGLCYGPPVTGPDQALGGSTILASDGDASYANIMSSYYAASARKWDSAAQATYLSFATPTGPAGCTYLSYDDEQSVTAKGDFLKSEGLGGVIEWEINEGYIASAAAGQRSPLLSAIGAHVLH